jgi:hypothetical protein
MIVLPFWLASVQLGERPLVAVHPDGSDGKPTRQGTRAAPAGDAVYDPAPSVLDDVPPIVRRR